MVLRPDRDLLTAWLLLFLARGSGYGYGMGEQLREQELDVEMTVVYRLLRTLERERQVTSRWIESGTGPQRRLYSLTGRGRLTLDALVPVLADNRDRYGSFVKAYKRRAKMPAAALGEVEASQAERQLLAAWLLLLLDGDASYGYDLRRHLAEHEVAADPGKVYRLLRQLDDDEMLRSRWSDPILGPQRRVYSLTPRGRRRLHQLAALLVRACEVHDAFVKAYEQVNDDFRGPAGFRPAPRGTERQAAAE